jgi:hypothetical protein
MIISKISEKQKRSHKIIPCNSFVLLGKNQGETARLLYCPYLALSSSVLGKAGYNSPCGPTKPLEYLIKVIATGPLVAVGTLTITVPISTG